LVIGGGEEEEINPSLDGGCCSTRGGRGGGDETATMAVPLVSESGLPYPKASQALRRPEDREANTALAISEAPLQKQRVAPRGSNPSRSIHPSSHQVMESS
jgi:hypothetical protein